MKNSFYRFLLYGFIIFLFFVISGFAQFIIGLKEIEKVESILQNQGKTL